MTKHMGIRLKIYRAAQKQMGMWVAFNQKETS